MPDRHAELRAMLRTLRLPAVADTFADLALKAAKANLSHEAFLYEVVKAEVAQREQHRIARLRRRSGLPAEKTFRTLQLERFPPAVRQQVERLRAGAFLAEAVNVVAVGRPGVGKSHLLAAVAHEVVLQGHPVLWTATATLVQRLLAAKRDLRLPQALAQLDRFAFLVLDDIGYVQHSQDEMEVLFAVLSERYERKSVGISTNLVFSDWVRIFKSPLTTMAAIDSRRPPLGHPRPDAGRELPRPDRPRQPAAAGHARRRDDPGGARMNHRPPPTARPPPSGGGQRPADVVVTGLPVPLSSDSTP